MEARATAQFERDKLPEKKDETTALPVAAPFAQAVAILAEPVAAPVAVAEVIAPAPVASPVVV